MASSGSGVVAGSADLSGLLRGGLLRSDRDRSRLLRLNSCGRCLLHNRVHALALQPRQLAGARQARSSSCLAGRRRCTGAGMSVSTTVRWLVRLRMR